MTAHAEISYVSTKNEDEEDEFQMEDVKGSHSTKIEAVLKCLLKIRFRVADDIFRDGNVDQFKERCHFVITKTSIQNSTFC